MLKTLYVKNFALIEILTIEFGAGLNIITGETGAGKSILLGALGIVLGDRASSELIREGSDKAIVEAILDISNNKRLINLIEGHALTNHTSEMILRREISIKGQSRCFINDSPVSLAVLREAGDLAIDLHGQHEHQSLLRIDTHLSILDNYGGLGKLLEAYSEIYKKLSHLKKSLSELQAKEITLKEKQNLYEHQFKEISSLAPLPNEIETLQAEEKILENSEKLITETTELHELLYGGDDSVHNSLARAKKILDELARIDKSFSQLVAKTLESQTIVDEINQSVQSYNAKIDFHSDRLEGIRERLVALQQLKKKYGGTLEQAIVYQQKIEKELSLAENFEKEIKQLRTEIARYQTELSSCAIQLSLKRHEVSQHLSHSVENELKKLGIQDGTFCVSFQNTEKADGDVIFEQKRFDADQTGFDKVEFLISANIGEPPKPLVKVASGGEISRIMLALKTILAKSEQLPILVFDEIDTGISGKVAQSVGFSLKELARFHQIIVITHLPQVASMSDLHFRVEKSVQGERTYSSVKMLSEEEHEIEVAKLIAGATITEASRRSAKELIQAGKSL